MTEEQDKNALQNLPDNQARRKTIKKLVVGAGALAGYSMLPEKWTKPLVEQIVLPAHAQTSGITLINPLNLTLLSGTQSTTTVSVRVYGAVYPPTPNLAIGLQVIGALGGNTAAAAPEEGMLQKALATLDDFLVSEAVAAETCPQISQQVFSAEDGSFSADFEISCGPGMTSVSAIASLATSPAISAEGILLISADSNSSTPTATTEPSISASAYSFANSSGSTVTVEWEGLRTDTVGPGESVDAPEAINAFTNIWVTGTSYMFSCPSVGACFSGTFGGDMGLAIDSCGGVVAISNCLAPSGVAVSAAASARTEASIITKRRAW